MVMAKVFVIIGRSNSGKDTLKRLILNNEQKYHISFQALPLYTTRPMRYGEVDGVEYNFVNNTEFDNLVESNVIFESRKYTVNTPNGKQIWKYGTGRPDENKITTGLTYYVSIGTVNNLLDYYKTFGRKNVCPVFLTVAERTIIDRAISREENSINPNYAEMYRRLYHDYMDFQNNHITFDSDLIKKIYVADCENITIQLYSVGLTTLLENFINAVNEITYEAWRLDLDIPHE